MNRLSKYIESQQRNRRSKEEPNGRFRSDNTITKITKSSVNGPNRGKNQ